MIEYYYVIDMVKGKEKMSSSKLVNLRLSMVKYAKKHSISEAARSFKTTRKTVRKWVRRYEEKGIEGLEERSRAPHRVHNKTAKEIEDKVVKLRERHPKWGPARIKERYDLPLSEKAIWRILKDRGLIKRRRKKRDKVKDLREEKKRWEAFEYLQIDVKYLTDIPGYYSYMKGLKLPIYQYTMRDVRTGAMFYAYGYSRDTLNSSFFAEYVVSHIRGYREGRIIVQTDNGSEFIGNVLKKRGETKFEEVLKRYGVIYRRILPRRPTWNSDVEVVHRIIEDEFYDCEGYKGIKDFLRKAYGYQLYFNYERKIRYRGNKTPKEIMEEISDYPEEILSLPPIILDDIIPAINITGYHVQKSVIPIKNRYLTKEK